MADILSQVMGLFSKRYRDMGDGTHAEVVYVGGQAAGGESGDEVTVVTSDGAGATIGATADAAVTTNAAGTISAKLRGIVTLLAGILTVKLDQTTDGTTNAVNVKTSGGAGATIGATADAAVTTSAEGTLSGKLRGVVAILADVWVSASHWLKVAVATELPAGTQTIGATKDAGPSQTITRTYTANADFSTAREITAAPTAGQKIVALDIVVSMATACLATVQMETSNNVLAAAYLPANGTAVFTLRAPIKGDAADKKLLVKSSVASAGVVTAHYYSEA